MSDWKKSYSVSNGKVTISLKEFEEERKRAADTAVEEFAKKLKTIEKRLHKHLKDDQGVGLTLVDRYYQDQVSRTVNKPS